MTSLKVENAGFSFPGGCRVFSNISFEIHEGEIFCLLGPNGAGKSTLLNCVSSLYSLTYGRVMIDGKNMTEMEQREISRYIGYVPQSHQTTFAYTVREFVLMGRAPHINLFETPGRKDYEIADRALAMFGIEFLSGKFYTELSGGEQQQVLFARAVAQQPRIILLDEPTTHLDFGNQVRAMRQVKALADQGYLVVMTTHYPDQVLMMADKVAIIKDHGLKALGTPQEIMTKENMEETYGMEVCMAYVNELDRTVCLPANI